MSNAEVRTSTLSIRQSIFDTHWFLFLLFISAAALSTHLASGESKTTEVDGFRKMLAMAGIDEDQLARFVDGDSLSTEELPAVFQLLFRLQQPDKAQLDRWTHYAPSLETWIADPEMHRAELAWIEGDVLSFEKMLVPADLARIHPYSQLYLCELALAGGVDTCLALTPHVPNSWLAAALLPQSVRLRGLFLKTVRLESSTNKDARIPLFVTPHIAWYPTENAPPGQLLLAAQGMDVALLDEVKQWQPFVKPDVSREGEAFYACLSAVCKAGQDKLTRSARDNLPSVVKHWRDVKHAAANDRQALQEKLAGATGEQKTVELSRLTEVRRRELLAGAVIKQAVKGEYSVAPLFIQPEQQVGHLTIIEGIARRAVRVAVEGADSPSCYYELEVFTSDSENLPVVCCAAEVPIDFPLGDSIRVPVRLAGVFFKSWLYRTRQLNRATQDTDQHALAKQKRLYAPIVIGAKIEQLPVSSAADNRWGIGAGVAVLLLLAAVWAILAWNEKQDCQHRLRLRQ